MKNFRISRQRLTKCREKEMAIKTIFKEIKFLLKKSWWIWLIAGVGVTAFIIITGSFINWDGSSWLFWVAFFSGGFIPMIRLRGKIRSENFSLWSVYAVIVAGGLLTFVITIGVFLGIFLLSTGNGQTFY
jgi:hypothetical protein